MITSFLMEDFMKKFLLSAFVLALFVLFLGCSFDGFNPDFSSVSISAPDFFITDFKNGTTNLDDNTLSKYYAYKKNARG